MELSTAQRPTLSGFLISCELDALRVMEACRLYPTQFPLITERLNDWRLRSDLIRHGSVFVFRRREKFVRWTDGRRWLSNQQVGPFLTYREALRHPSVRNSYRQGLNKKENGYRRPSLQQLEGGLAKWTFTAQIVIDPSQPHVMSRLEMVFYLASPKHPQFHEPLSLVDSHPILGGLPIPPDTYYGESGQALPRNCGVVTRIVEGRPINGLHSVDATVIRSTAAFYLEFDNSVPPSLCTPMSLPGRSSFSPVQDANRPDTPLFLQRHELSFRAIDVDEDVTNSKSVGISRCDFDISRLFRRSNVHSYDSLPPIDPSRTFPAQLPSFEQLSKETLDRDN